MLTQVYYSRLLRYAFEVWDYKLMEELLNIVLALRAGIDLSSHINCSSKMR